MPVFSIIIPTYNSSKTIAVALESVLKQSFIDFEIIIVDGLSKDSTLDIIKSFRDERIKIYSEKDNGIYEAMNKGVDLAKDSWLFFMGSDDRFFTPHILEQIFNTDKKNNYDVIYGDVYSTRFNGRYDGEFTVEKILKKNICHQSIFFNKSIFNKIGYFNLKYKAQADWDHNMRWILSSTLNKVYFNCIIAEYADGGFSSINGDSLFDREKVLKYLIYGKKTISTSKRVQLLVKELKRTVLYDKSHFLKIVYNIPKVIFGV